MGAAEYWQKRCKMVETEYKLSLLSDIETLSGTADAMKRLRFKVWFYKSMFERERERADKLERQLKALFE